MGYRVTEFEKGPLQPAFSWIVICFLGLVVSVAAAAMLSDQSISKTGFVLSGLGLVVSLAGFSFTISQLRRTETATSAATRALQAVRNEFAALDVLTELHAVRAAAETARENTLGLRWPSVNQGFDRIRERLMRIISVPDQLRTDEIEEAKNFVAFLLGAVGEIENLTLGQEFQTGPITNRLREVENYAVSTEYRIRDQFSGS